jgi:predicted nucleic acid-binding protein
LSAYVDSSFLVSGYIVDAHSSIVDQRRSGVYSIYLTPFHRAEFCHALHQQVFLRRLSPSESQLAWIDFERDCATGLWMRVQFPTSAWETTASLARSYGATLGVRTLDSLHVACALELKAERFWTFDDRQARLAEAVGFDTSA